MATLQYVSQPQLDMLQQGHMVSRPTFVQAQLAGAQQQRLQFAGGAQIINAFNADGQPVTIAVNNGTHTLMNNAAQQPASLQFRVAPQQQANTLRLAPGQQYVQLPNGEIVAVQSAAPTPQAHTGAVYKVVQGNQLVQVQQAGATANGTTLAMGANSGLQLQQVFVAGAGAQGKGATYALRPTNPAPQPTAMPVNLGGAVQMQAQAAPQGIQMGRSLIHVGTRPNTITTYNPNTGIRNAGNAPAGTTLLQAAGGVAGMQQVQLQNAAGMQQVQLQNGTILMQAGQAGISQGAAAQHFLVHDAAGGAPRNVFLQQPAGATTGMQVQNSADVTGQVPNVQQQVRDTVAQQRQQQLLASLRAQLTNATASTPATSAPVFVHANGVGSTAGVGTAAPPQVVRLQAAAGAGAPVQTTNQQLSGLQGLLAAQQQAQQAAAMQAQVQAQAAQHNQALAQHAQQIQLLQAQQAQLQQAQARNIAAAANANAARTAAAMAGGQPANVFSVAPAGANGSAAPSAPRSVDTRSISGDSLGAMLGGAQAMGPSADRAIQQAGAGGQVAASSPPSGGPAAGLANGSLSKENLDSILYSIGVELARHGFTVAQAISAGWLGVLSDADVAALQQAYAAEEQAIKSTRGGSTTPALPVATPASARSTTPSVASSAQSRRASASHILEQGSGLPPRPSTGLPPARPPHMDTIPDACFSAFAYDFFGAPDKATAGDDELFVALEASEGALGDTTHAHSLRSSSSFTGTGTALGGKSSTAASFAGDGKEMLAAAMSGWGAPHPTRSQSAGLQGGALSLSDAAGSSGELPGSGPAPASGTPSKLPCSSTASLEDQELMDRIANLDLGCGFY